MSTLFRHPRIYTGDATEPFVTGLLVEGEHIVASGDADRLRALHSGIETVELTGPLVLPGMNDAHIHTAAVARALVAVDLRPATTLADALTILRGHLDRVPLGGWLLGGRWDSNKWERPVQPTAADLDSATGDVPAALDSIDGHTLWVNSAALRLAGITAQTPDPPGGQIVRDSAGNPTGILRESAAGLIEHAATDATEDLPALLRGGQEHLLSVGLTSVTDLNGEDARTAYLALKAEGDLKLRVTKGIPVNALPTAIEQGRRTGDGDDWMRVGPVKLFSDGALGSRTCHMSSPFHGDPGNVGMPVMSVPEMYDAALRAVRSGIAVATHAIGDQANHLVIDVYERLRHETGTRLPLSIEHTQFVQPRDVARLLQFGITASMQPTHCTSDIDLVTTLLPDHELIAYGWRTLLDAGVPVAFGSDAPVEEADPFLGLYAAVSRQRIDETPSGGWQPSERISIREAIAAYTAGSATLSGDGGRKGRLVPGQLADLISVDTDLTASETVQNPSRIRDTKVLTTVVGGRIRWSR